MSRLHVCVDWIIFPFGNVIFNGEVVNFLLTKGAPCTRKFPVAPESETAYCIASLNLDGWKIRIAVGSLARLLAWTMFCHALLRVGALTTGGGAWVSRGTSLLSDHPLLPLLSTVATVISSAVLEEHLLLIHTVVSPSSSSSIMAKELIVCLL